MEIMYYKMHQVVVITGLSRATIYRLISRGDFPQGYHLSYGRVGWKNLEIEEWLLSRKTTKA